MHTATKTLCHAIHGSMGHPVKAKNKPSTYHYGAEIPIEEIRLPMAIPNRHLE